MFRLPQDYSTALTTQLQLAAESRSQGSKHARDETAQSEYQVSPAAKKTNQARGKNWNERDSLLLIEAVEYADGTKKRILTHMRIILTKESESKASVDKRMSEFYNSLTPSEPRTVKAALSRFAEMESSYKFK